jgi:hypothetical protein
MSQIPAITIHTPRCHLFAAVTVVSLWISYLWKRNEIIIVEDLLIPQFDHISMFTRDSFVDMIYYLSWLRIITRTSMYEASKFDFNFDLWNFLCDGLS